MLTMSSSDFLRGIRFFRSKPRLATSLPFFLSPRTALICGDSALYSAPLGYGTNGVP